MLCLNETTCRFRPALHMVRHAAKCACVVVVVGLVAVAGLAAARTLHVPAPKALWQFVRTGAQQVLHHLRVACCCVAEAVLGRDVVLGPVSSKQADTWEACGLHSSQQQQYGTEYLSCSAPCSRTSKTFCTSSCSAPQAALHLPQVISDALHLLLLRAISLNPHTEDVMQNSSHSEAPTCSLCPQEAPALFE